MLDAREPPHGDFVAYVEKIEREQLARALRPHMPRRLGDSEVAVSVHGEADRQPLVASEPQQALQSLQKSAAGSAPGTRGPLIGAAIGAALIAFGLIAEGGIILVLVGAVLLWHNLRKLRQPARPSGAASAGRDVERAFGRQSPRNEGGRSR